MIRIAALTALIALTLPAAAQVGQPPAPSLKPEAIVMSEIVRIGDLVDNAGPVADVAIFRAPDLGQTGSVSANRVVDAVRPHHIIDLDSRGLTEVVVTRASRMITAKDFEARIVHALSGQTGNMDGKNLTLIFDNDVRTLQVEPKGTELRVSRMSFDPRNGRFDVSFEVSGSTVARRMPLRFSGSLTETFETVVPVRTIASGDIVRPSDLTVVRRPKAEFAAAVVTTAEQATGLAARHPLRAGQVLRQADLVKPELVGRNETVTITYEVPGIVLTMRGQAQEAGALGDVISVVNVQSKKTIQATIIGPGRVSVGSSPPRLAANVLRSRSSNSAR